MSSTLCIHTPSHFNSPASRNNIVQVSLNILSMKPSRAFELSFRCERLREKMLNLLNNEQIDTTHIILNLGAI